jgi:hypothetical protein
VKDYLEKGYVPRDIGINESAARTLEYAYNWTKAPPKELTWKKEKRSYRSSTMILPNANY